MQKFLMFEDVPADHKIMYPTGTIKSKAEVQKDYPLLATPMGVVGVTVGKDGVLTNPVMMTSYYNVMSFEQMYADQGCEFADGLSNAQKCDVVSEFVNKPAEKSE